MQNRREKKRKKWNLLEWTDWSKECGIFKKLDKDDKRAASTGRRWQAGFVLRLRVPFSYLNWMCVCVCVCVCVRACVRACLCGGVGSVCAPLSSLLFFITGCTIHGSTQSSYSSSSFKSAPSEKFGLPTGKRHSSRNCSATRPNTVCFDPL